MDTTDDESRIVSNLDSSGEKSAVWDGILSTNDRVIARVTDGIYRQPGSAIRELIVNAYDADATWVSVNTDAPRFESIVVEDNGNGMTPAAVANLLCNIGGSAKRSNKGIALDITDPNDSTKSPGGRPLIGKLGIGIFSISQLANQFSIITKTAGSRYKVVVSVSLYQFSDRARESEERYQAGRFRYWKEPTADVESHGTTILLTSLKPAARDALSDKQFWTLCGDENNELGDNRSVTFPEYYVGRVDSINDELGHLQQFVDHPAQKLPWDEGDQPDDRFRKLVDVVWNGTGSLASFQLTRFFDAYLRMIWNIALSLPLPYVEKNLFDESVAGDWGFFYRLSNSIRGKAERVIIPPDVSLETSIRDFTGIGGASSSHEPSDFKVIFDGISLKRPIKFRNLPPTTHAIQKPMVFLGSFREDFSGFDENYSAGPLAFEAYLFWNSKVAPTEHQGCLVRIHGASGTLFDQTFFNYQVAEITRMHQTICEIFVTEGLEAALNIDRESFNTAHPHAVLLARWLHSAFRQLSNAQKALSSELRAERRRQNHDHVVNQLLQVVDEANLRHTGGEGIVPDIRISTYQAGANNGGSTKPIGELSLGNISESQTSKVDAFSFELPVQSSSKGTNNKLAAIAQVLEIYGLLSVLSKQQQVDLLSSILGIIEVELDG